MTDSTSAYLRPRQDPAVRSAGKTAAPPLSGWQRAAACAAEGLCLLARLVPWLLAFSAHLLPDAVPVLPAPFSALRPALPVIAAAVLQGLLLPPLRLARLSFYRALVRRPQALPLTAALAEGFRHYGAAVGWRWRLWCRRTALLCAAVFAAALIWSTAARTGWSVLGLPIGAAVLLGGLLGTAVWLCRYAAAPLLLLEGFPAGAALQLSVRIMRGHRAALIDRFGSRLPAMLGCLLLLPVPWLLPRLRIGRTALLVRWRQQTALPGSVPVPPGGTVKTGR